jgi:hypothetical protein
LSGLFLDLVWQNHYNTQVNNAQEIAMRIEVVNGRKLVCEHIFPASEVKIGQIWTPADGADREGVITAVDEHDVYYTDSKFGDFHNDAFGFQCRYCNVVD